MTKAQKQYQAEIQAARAAVDAAWAVVESCQPDSPEELAAHREHMAKFEILDGLLRAQCLRNPPTGPKCLGDRGCGKRR